MRMTTNGTDYSRTECRKQMAIKKKKKKNLLGGVQMGYQGVFRWEWMLTGGGDAWGE